jgi:hypothetical protein
MPGRAKRKKRGEQYSSSGGSGVGGLVSALVGAGAGGAPELTTQGADYLKPNSLGTTGADEAGWAPDLQINRAQPEHLYKAPSFWQRLVNPGAANNAIDAEQGYQDQRIGGQLDLQNKLNEQSRLDKAEVADLQEQKVLQAKAATGTIAPEESARLAQLEYKFADKQIKAATATQARLAATHGEALFSEKLNADRAKYNNEQATAESGTRRIPSEEAAVISGNNLQKLRNTYSANSVPLDTAARDANSEASIAEARKRGELAQRVPEENNPLYREFTTEGLGSQKVGPGYEKEQADRAAAVKSQQAFSAEQSRLNREALAERQQVGIDARGAGKSLMDIINGGGDTGATKEPTLIPGVGRIVPRTGGSAKVNPAQIDSIRNTPTATTPTVGANSLGSNLVPVPSTATPAFTPPTVQAGGDIPFSSRDSGLAGLVNAFNPGSPNNMVNKIAGTPGMGVLGDAYIKPYVIDRVGKSVSSLVDDLTPKSYINPDEGPDWFKSLPEEEKRKILDQYRQNKGSRVNPADFQ